MNREDEKKKEAISQDKQHQSNKNDVANNQNRDDDEHSYPGRLDKVEGSMNNGEIGGGIKKEEE